MTEPPDIKSLDFSQFHPLDHSLWDCEHYPGGKRTHLRYRWDFQWRDGVLRWLRCPLRLHSWVTWWRTEFPGGPPVPQGESCRYCGKDKNG